MSNQTPQEELYHIQESTNADGTIDVEITDWKKKQNSAVVYFQMPDITKNKERMLWPEKDSVDNKFVRLVNNCGYDIAAVDQIIGETVKYDNESGELFIPKQKTILDRMKKISDLNIHRINPIYALCFPIVYFILLPLTLFKKDFELEGSSEVRGILVGGFFWNLLLIFLLLL